MKNTLTLVAKFITIYFVAMVIIIMTGNVIVKKRVAQATPQIQIKYIVQKTEEPSITPVETEQLVALPSSQEQSSTTVVRPTSTPIITASPVPTPRVLTLKDQAGSHASSSDCWLVINSHVYDITSYFGMHPGGNDVLSKYCGKDATSAFKTKDKQNGTDHTQNAYSLLEQYRID